VIMNALDRISNARAELESVRDLAELKNIRDTAIAAETYARAKRLGTEAVSYAQEIINRAERRIGEILTETPRQAGPGRGKTSPVSADVSPRKAIGEKLSARSQQIASLDEQTFERNVTKPVTRLARIARDLRARSRPPAVEDQYWPTEIRHGDFREVLADITADAIITDPPYAREYLPLYADLAKWADSVLTDDGVLAVLTGNYYLPEVFGLLTGYRPYRWTMAYLTPGPGYAAMHARVQSHWKPVLLYGAGPRLDDVVRAVDSPSGEAHRWQQSLSGFTELVSCLTEPGQTVADPFAGSGTTLIAARQLGRRGIGADIDAVQG
jgi:DNA methylase